jgi:Flp pilus assembly secretin CpaC
VAALSEGDLPRVFRLLSLSAGLLFVLGTFNWSAAADETIVLSVHQSRIIEFPGDVADVHCGTKTLVLSDPLVADVALVSNTAGKLFVAVVGKSYGATNLAAYDCKGIELTKKIVEVTGPQI